MCSFPQSVLRGVWVKESAMPEFDVVEIASALQLLRMKINCSMWMRISAGIRAREIQDSSVEGQLLFISMQQVSTLGKHCLTSRYNLTSLSIWVATIWGQLLPGSSFIKQRPGG